MGGGPFMTGMTKRLSGAVASLALLAACGGSSETKPAVPETAANPSPPPVAPGVGQPPPVTIPPSPPPDPAPPPAPLPSDPPPATHHLTLKLTGTGGANLIAIQSFFTTVSSPPVNQSSFSGLINCPSTTCEADFPTGSTVPLTFGTESYALTVSDYALHGWTGDCAADGNTCTATMDKDLVIEARIDYTPHAVVALRIEGTGSGTVGSNLAAADEPLYRYDYMDPIGATREFLLAGGQSLVLTPSSADGTRPGVWTEGCSGSGPCTIDFPADGSSFPPSVVTVRFELVPSNKYSLHTVPPELTPLLVTRSGLIVAQEYVATPSGGAMQTVALYDPVSGSKTYPMASVTENNYGIIPTAVNTRGDIAGLFISGEFANPFVAYADGRVIILDDSYAQATGVGPVHSFGLTRVGLNDSGVIVGTVAGTDTYTSGGAFRFDGTSLSWLGDSKSQAYAINSQGVAAGCIPDAAFGGSGFVPAMFSDTIRTFPVDFPYPTNFCFRTLNDAGIGGATVGGKFNEAMVWDGHQATVLDSMWNTEAINAVGQIAGEIDLGGTEDHADTIYTPQLHAAVWDKGVVSDLNGTVETNGAVLITATGINDAGMIVGQIAQRQTWYSTSGVSYYLLIPR